MRSLPFSFTVTVRFTSPSDTGVILSALSIVATSGFSDTAVISAFARSSSRPMLLIAVTYNGTISFSIPESLIC